MTGTGVGVDFSRACEPAGTPAHRPAYAAGSAHAQRRQCSPRVDGSATLTAAMLGRGTGSSRQRPGISVSSAHHPASASSEGRRSSAEALWIQGGKAQHRQHGQRRCLCPRPITLEPHSIAVPYCCTSQERAPGALPEPGEPAAFGRRGRQVDCRRQNEKDGVQD